MNKLSKFQVIIIIFLLGFIASHLPNINNSQRGYIYGFILGYFIVEIFNIYYGLNYD
jgi:diacylglycerol kinase